MNNAAYTEGPAMAYQATGGAEWQRGDGWGYRPVNKATLAHQLRRLAVDIQQVANATAALGMGRWRYPEWSEELASLARRMAVWAEEIETEVAADAAESEGE